MGGCFPCSVLDEALHNAVQPVDATTHLNQWLIDFMGCIHIPGTHQPRPPVIRTL